jgi:hypothetical protein
MRERNCISNLFQRLVVEEADCIFGQIKLATLYLLPELPVRLFVRGCRSPHRNRGLQQLTW